MKYCRPIIELRDVGMRYGQEWIYRNVSLDVCRGDFLAVSGDSGDVDGRLALVLAVVED